MTAEVKWLEPEKILTQIFAGQVTAEEYSTVIDTCLETLDQASAPIHVIADWRGAETFPFLAETLPKAVKILRHRNFGGLAVMPVNSVLIYREEILMQITPFRYQFCLNPEKALQFLHSLQPETTAA